MPWIPFDSVPFLTNDLLIQTAFAPSDPIPLDAALTHGELDNGLKYFVLPNEAPANRTL